MSGQLADQLGQVTAALCAGAGAWLLAGGAPARHRARTLAAGGAPARGVPPRRRPRLPRALSWVLSWALARPGSRVVLCCLAAGALLGVWGRSPLPPLAAALLAPLAARWWRRRREREAAARRREAVIDLCRSLACEVRAGRPPGPSLVTVLVPERAAELGRDHRAALLAAARYGGDVPGALRAAAARPGAGGLSGVAACWEVATDQGASLAAGLERVAEALRAEHDQHEELRAQLAGPRVTALMLAGLPVVGLLLGSAMGAAPLRELLHTPLGLACLGAGALLEGAGLAWTAALTRAAERSAP
ncbi:type II secretion system F family protein [Streptomyces sp. 7-21]|uniref:type II secretion system F family protein n=1 Tax=Streptomyces sp. 7-21 TaxID=2802283 RepID=UPI0027DE0EC9|nr:type II secretion system F family protein [Streptomyces sp. 7-21]